LKLFDDALDIEVIGTLLAQQVSVGFHNRFFGNVGQWKEDALCLLWGE
jgi:hypothetical protein